MAHITHKWTDPGIPDYAQFVAGQPLKHGLSLLADMALGPWNAAAKHRLLHVVGFVHLRLAIMVTESLDSAGGAFVFEGVGPSSNTDLYYTNASPQITLQTGAILQKNGLPTPYLTPTSDAVWEGVVGHDVFYEITGAAGSDGQMLFVAYWTAVAPGSRVDLGDGASS